MNDWDDLRYFLAVARDGSVTKAARTLGVNHTTVSRRIQSLESRHNVRLFEKLSKGYRLTPAAKEIMALAIELEEKNLQVSRRLFGHDDQLQGSINLTMPHDIFEFCLADSIAEFRRSQPEIDLNLSVAKGLKNMAAREADIAIRLTDNPPDYLIGRKITNLHHGIYVNDKLSLKNKVPVISWIGEENVPEWSRELFDNSEVVMRVDDLFSMYCAVRAGIGAARMPCYIADFIGDHQVKRLRADLAPSAWGIWVLSHVDLRSSAKVKCCKDFLTEEIISKKGGFEGKLSDFID